MIAAAANPLSEEFTVPAIAVDDHREEMSPVTRAMRKWNVKPRLFTTATEWGRVARSSDENTILMSDNLLPGVNDLGSLGFDDIHTSQGEEAGLRLLTAYCDRLNIKAGLKILLTQYPLRDEAKHYIAGRRRTKKDEIHVFHKNNANDSDQLNKLVRGFSRTRKAMFIKSKIEYVRDLGRDWRLTESEIAALFSMQDEDDAVWRASTGGTTSIDFERRCDLIYRIKINLAAVYGGENLFQEERWLRTKIAILGGKSPLEFISSQGVERLYALISIMEGNH